MRRSLLLVALLAGASSLRAQGAPATDAAIQRIWTLGMDSSQTPRLAQQLLDSLGPRLLGSPDMKRAQDWAIKTLGGWGIDAKHEQFGTWRGWRRGYSHIDLIAPRVRTLEGMMLGFSPGTNKKDKVAETLVLPHFADSTEFVKWLPAVKGKLVLVSAPMQSCRPTEDIVKNGTPATISRDSAWRAENAREWGGRNVRGTGLSLALGGGELAVRLEEAGAAGVISSRPTNSRGGLALFETYTTKVPTVALSCEDYGLVFRLTDNNQHPKIRLNLDAELLGEQPISNVVGRIPGTTKPNEYVLLSAHFDSWDGGSGATDNATGSVMMLEAMRILKQVLPNPQRTILIGLWAGEEEGLVGSGAFAEDHPEVLKGLQAMFNQDNGTGRVMRVGAGGLPNGAVHLSSWLKQLPTAFQTAVPFDGSPGRPSSGGTDDASFACHGVPVFGMGGASWDYGVVTWHTTRDTFDKVVFDDLKHNATLVASLAYLASEDPSFITRERVDLSTLPAGGRPGVPARAGGPPPMRAWPTCTPVPRVTKPRLK
ncbi:MAG: M20/M25/M40 family metallo-hydrolase [Gemmatimonadetes bacterium]|nr:M20/M25/M40 family metallo-hydrolase [Gemmatimonadota bacterium]